MGDQGRPGNGPIRFKTSFSNTIYEAMKTRGWRETNSNTDWDLTWAERELAYETLDTRHLLNWQRVNHFRNDRELCRKDLLVKNLKKRRRSMQREGQHEEAERHDFWPTTYVLPGEYALFAEESKRRPGSKWIMKPVARSQGRGIFIVTKLSQVSKWKSDARRDKAKEDGPEPYVVQRYITNPYLVAGRKFDMRLYVLLTSFMPMSVPMALERSQNVPRGFRWQTRARGVDILRSMIDQRGSYHGQVWVYREGFCRFSHVRYSTASEDLEDMEKHLTNIAIQKRTESYDKEFGGKWGIRKLKLHLMALHGVQAVNQLFYDIQSLILKSLLSVQQVIINDKHCFGLYGYDILFDERLKPWLLEVNASPSLSASTPSDKDFKIAMVSSALDVIDLEGRKHGDEIRVGGFDLVYAGGSSVDISRGKGGAQRLYTTALGTEIPQERVERTPCTPETTNALSSGAKRESGNEATRRHPGLSTSRAGRSSGGDVGGTGGYHSTRSSWRGSSGGSVGGSGDAGTDIMRSSSSSGRGARVGLSDCSSRGESHGEGRPGRSETGRAFFTKRNNGS